MAGGSVAWRPRVTIVRSLSTGRIVAALLLTALVGLLAYDLATDAPDPPKWTRVDGREGSRYDISEFEEGPEHCDWQAAAFFEVGGFMYVRDPEGVTQGYTREDMAELYQPNAAVPSSARLIARSDDGRELWKESGLVQYIYVVDGDIAQGWPWFDSGCA